MKNLNLFGFLVSVLIMGACSKSPKTYESASFETFTVDNEDIYNQANQILQADYMFVVDGSASMNYNSANQSDVYASKRQEFMSGLTNFVDTLESTNVNYRIGFINGHPNQTATGQRFRGYVEGMTEGVFDLAKAAGAVTQGQLVYWDNVAKNVTTTATSNKLIGVATQAALSGDANVRVKVTGQVS